MVSSIKLVFLTLSCFKASILWSVSWTTCFKTCVESAEKENVPKTSRRMKVHSMTEAAMFVTLDWRGSWFYVACVSSLVNKPCVGLKTSQWIGNKGLMRLASSRAVADAVVEQCVVQKHNWAFHTATNAGWIKSICHQSVAVTKATTMSGFIHCAVILLWDNCNFQRSKCVCFVWKNCWSWHVRSFLSTKHSVCMKNSLFMNVLSNVSVHKQHYNWVLYWKNFCHGLIRYDCEVYSVQ